MSNNKDDISRQLTKMGLDADEARVYLELLPRPTNHTQLSFLTGINRTKVYRIVENLMKRSLVARKTDDTGTFLIATDPKNLEITLVQQEERVKEKRHTYKDLLPYLQTLKQHDHKGFVVQTYQGDEGMKQMAWHELQTKGELLSIGGQTIEDLFQNKLWAQRHRMLTLEANYLIREIINYDVDLPTYTKNDDFMHRYSYRQLPSDVVYFYEQLTIYNDTVATYSWRGDKKVGVEIIGHTYAGVMRNIFEHYWQLGKEGIDPKLAHELNTTERK